MTKAPLMWQASRKTPTGYSLIQVDGEDDSMILAGGVRKIHTTWYTSYAEESKV